MTKNEAIELVNESLIDQDSKFTREINALFKTQDVVDMLQQAYDMSDENAKLSLMDATEKQFLDKFAKDGGSGDDDKEDTDTDSLDFEEDGSDLDFEEDGSDLDGSDNSADFGGDEMFGDETADDTTAPSGDDSNPFASDFGGGEEPAPAESSNPFESWVPGNGINSLNESLNRTPKKTLKRRKK